jgi:hypothetical protein
MFMSIFITSLFATWVSFSAWSRPPLEVIQEVLVSQEAGDANQEAFHKAVEDASLKLIADSVGTDVLERNSGKIKQIIDRSEKYILFIKGSAPETTSEGAKIKVSMKISLDNLEALLREFGLLQGTGFTLKLLPLVTWTDGEKDYAWWLESTTQRDWAKLLASLNGQLKARNIKLADHLSLERVPPALRKADLSRAEQIQLGKLFDASLILFGDVRLNKSDSGDKAKLHTELIQVRGEKTLASDTTSLSTKPVENMINKIAEAINGQVKMAQGSGRMNTGNFRITIQGALSFKQLEQIRKELLEQVLDIRSLRDRLYEADQVVFEAESNKTTVEIVAAIEKSRFSKMKIDVREGSGGLILHVKPL